MRLAIQVPEDADRGEAWRLVQAIEDHLSGKAGMVVLRRPPGIPDARMPVVVARLVAILLEEAHASSEGHIDMKGGDG